ncbi:unnamed protein product [Arabis nemorensis]|uniref:Terpene synthase metal-binding domain-containing protein n=1 Tax=Arabis nemorensis TaxID=586526 RepID=A0A565CFC4_9BRAS|nr:unnamed protein product [Arabis nemorensis]
MARSCSFTSVVFPILVVSYADVAQDVMKTHDLRFANRRKTKAVDIIMNGGRDVAFSSYGEYRRHMKSLCTVHLLGKKMVKSFEKVREEEITAMMEKLEQHWNMEILVAMEYISFYEQENDHNETLLKISKLNSKYYRFSYLKELKIVTKWYKELNFKSKLPPYFRDRIVELHFFVLSMYFEPQFSRARIMC